MNMQNLTEINEFDFLRHHELVQIDVLKSRLEQLFKPENRKQTYKVSKALIERVIKNLNAHGKGKSVVEYTVKTDGEEERFAIFAINNRLVTVKIGRALAEMSNYNYSNNIQSPFLRLPKESIEMEDLYLGMGPGAVEPSQEKITLEEFLEATNRYNPQYLLPVSIYQDERPIVVCNDGFRLSIQASKYHLCTPLKNNRTDYTTFELSMLSEEIPELEEFKIYDNGPLNRFDTQTYGFVPREIVEEILEEHGGINKELTLKPMKLDGIRLQTRGLEHVNNYLDDIEMDVQILENGSPKESEIEMDI